MLDHPAFWEVVRWYFGKAAVGFPPDVPPALEELAAVLAAFLSERKELEDRLRMSRKPVPRPVLSVLSRVATT